ncbi:MAG: hypothetical protein H6888_05410 [Nitratireductor sp.]|nr:hypothetical protein [Nitratireductor sp.]
MRTSIRLIAVLLMLAGAGLVFLWPEYQKGTTGDEVARVRVFERKLGGWKDGWLPARVQLNESYNPVRIRLEGEFVNGLDETTRDLLDTRYRLLPFQVSLVGPEGPVLSGPVQVDSGVSPGENINFTRKFRYFVPDIGIVASGEHAFNLSLDVDRDLGLAWVDAVFIAHARPVDNTLREPGIALIGIGAMIFLLSTFLRGRRGSKQKPAKKPRRWGRNG